MKVTEIILKLTTKGRGQNIEIEWRFFMVASKACVKAISENVLSNDFAWALWR